MNNNNYYNNQTNEPIINQPGQPQNNNMNNPYYQNSDYKDNFQENNNRNNDFNYDANNNNNPNLQSSLNKDFENSSSNNFDEQVNKMMRIGFIRKVYGVLTCQLLFTALLSSIGFITSVQDYYSKNTWLLWTSLALSLVVIIPLACCRKVARKVPLNYFLLFTFTACESIMLSYVFASIRDWKIVFTAAVITIAVTGALTVYACTTKTDFTYCGGLLFVSITLLFFLGLFSIVFGGFLRILYCVLGILVYSIYLIFDTQLVMGKFGVEYQIDDYIIATLNIYLDIIQIFLYILSILGGSRR